MPTITKRGYYKKCIDITGKIIIKVQTNPNQSKPIQYIPKSQKGTPRYISNYPCTLYIRW